MSDSFKPWRIVRRNRTFRRKLTRSRQRIDNVLLRASMNSVSQNDEIEVGISAPQSDSEDVSFSDSDELNIFTSSSNVTVENEAAPNSGKDHVDNEVEPNIENELVEDAEASCARPDASCMRTFLRRWAIQYNIPARTLTPLFAQLNDVYRTRLPKDPRSLLGTRQKEPQQLLGMVGGFYWHQGFEKCIERCFSQMQTPMAISININIDGIPIYNNGNSQFWPILFNVHEFPAMKPMAIGIFYGHSKPKKVEEFLQPFVDEMIPILNNGVIVNGFRLDVKIRAFICDTPARSFLKGV